MTTHDTSRDASRDTSRDTGQNAAHEAPRSPTDTGEARDALMDPSAPEPAALAALEATLAPLADTLPTAPPALPPRPRVTRAHAVRRRTRWAVAGGLAAACVAGLVLFFAWPWALSKAPPWTVRTADAEAHVNGAAADGATLHAGAALETAAGTARIAVGTVGHMTVAPHTRLERTGGANGHRFRLTRGTVHADVDAPPRLLIVDTPAAAAVDLGCAYTLEVTAAGRTVLVVESGAVALEGPAGSAFDVLVPAGATASAYAGRTRVPVFLDAPSALADALDTLSEAPDDRAALETMRTHARPRDALSVWHVLARAPAAVQHELAAQLARLVPDAVPPTLAAAATRPALNRHAAAMVRPLDVTALAAWRDALRRAL